MIVEQYESVLMENVQGMLGIKPYLFKPVSHLGGAYTEHPLPGKHVDCVRYDRDENPVGKIVGHLLHDHLMRNRTKLLPFCYKQSGEILELYADIRLKYSRSQGGVRVKKAAQCVRGRMVPNQLRDTPFFINPHHQSLFGQLLPQVQNRLQGGADLRPEDFNALNLYPRTRDALTASGMVAA